MKTKNKADNNRLERDFCFSAATQKPFKRKLTYQKMTLITETSNFKILKWIIFSCGLISVLIYQFVNLESKNIFLVIGIVLICTAYLFEISEEVSTGVARIYFGAEAIYRKVQPFRYWFIFFLHFMLFVGGMAMAYLFYKFL